jgi:bacterioferritin
MTARIYPFAKKILDQNIKGERCANEFYRKLLEATHGKDPVTYSMVLQILQDKVEHQEDLQALFEDLEMMLKK